MKRTLWARSLTEAAVQTTVTLVGPNGERVEIHPTLPDPQQTRWVQLTHDDGSELPFAQGWTLEVEPPVNGVVKADFYAGDEGDVPSFTGGQATP